MPHYRLFLWAVISKPSVVFGTVCESLSALTVCVYTKTVSFRRLRTPEVESSGGCILCRMRIRSVLNLELNEMAFVNVKSLKKIQILDYNFEKLQTTL